MTLNYLVIAGIFSFVASALHLGIIFGGPKWYRFFGAGERMAQQAEINPIKPAVITLCIALVLVIWGLYAWSGAGIVPKLPLLKLGLVLITSIYIVRGIGGIAAPFISEHPAVKENSKAFWIWSSLICLLLGVIHLLGVVTLWQYL